MYRGKPGPKNKAGTQYADPLESKLFDNSAPAIFC